MPESGVTFRHSLSKFVVIFGLVQPGFVNNSDGFIISRLSLDVGELLADETVSDPKYIDCAA